MLKRVGDLVPPRLLARVLGSMAGHRTFESRLSRLPSSPLSSRRIDHVITAQLAAVPPRTADAVDVDTEPRTSPHHDRRPRTTPHASLRGTFRVHESGSAVPTCAERERGPRTMGTRPRRKPGQNVTCAWCKRTFPLLSTGRIPKYCGDACRHSAWENRRALARHDPSSRCSSRPLKSRDALLAQSCRSAATGPAGSRRWLHWRRTSTAAVSTIAT